MRTFLTVAICLVLMWVTTGCGNSVTTVEGQVKLDGQPLAEGAISFVPADGQSASGGNVIKGGHYTAECPPGAKKVEITAFKVTGKRALYAGDPNSPTVDTTEPIIPAKYNTATTLTAELKAGANKGVDFDLQSK